MINLLVVLLSYRTYADCVFEQSNKGTADKEGQEIEKILKDLTIMVAQESESITRV